MKTLNQLYIILLEYYVSEENKKSLDKFLCHCIEKYIDATYEERKMLMEHFQHQKPNKNRHKEFINIIAHDGQNLYMGTSAWWVSPTYYPLEAFDVRKRFIEKMIEITK